MSDIQDGEILYRYADPAAFPEGQADLPTSIFNDPELSCDWEKLQASPASSPHVANGRSMVVSIKVCEAIRNPTNPKRVGSCVPEWRQEILHDPKEEKEGDAFSPNESHSLIRGKKKGAVTTAIRDSSTFCIVSYEPPAFPASAENDFAGAAK